MPPPVAPLDFLKSHAPFDALGPEALRALGGALEVRYAEAGDVLLARGGSPSDALWIVRKGRVRLERDGEILETLEAGECFGFPSLLGGRPPLRDAVAVEPSLLFRVPAATFRRLLEEPRAARFFLEGLASRLRFRETATEAVRTHRLGPRPLVSIAGDESVGDAARRMRERGVGSLLVTRATVDGETGIPLAAVTGIVTDRDLRDRVLAAGLPATTAVGSIASPRLVTLEIGATSADALLEMARHGVRHLPVVEAGRIVGFVSASDLVVERSLHPLALRRDLERLPLSSLLPGWTDRVRRAVGELASSGVGAVRLGPIVATLTDGLVGRLIAEARLEIGGEDFEFAWWVHGSEGRQEQILPTDQDNALVYAAQSSEPRAQASAREAAGRLAAIVVGGLRRAGYPDCPGGYMATRWCDPVETWIERYIGWAAHPHESQRVDFTTFLDTRVVAGALDPAPLEGARAALGESRLFLRALAADAAAWPLPLGLWGGLREGEDGFDLKRGSLLVVALARLAALEAGSAARGTLDRLHAAGGRLGAESATLAEAFSYLAELRLELALDPVRRAEATSGHRLRLESLNALERRFLKDIFSLLRGVQKGLAARYAL